EGGRARTRDFVERGPRRLVAPVAGAPAEAADRAAFAPGRAPDAVKRLVEGRAALERELVLRERPRREVHVGVVQAGEDDAAAQVDDVGRGERGLVHSDAARDPLACDRERPLRRQLRVHRADEAVLEDHATDRIYAWRRSTT